MLIKHAVLDQIASGEVDLQFRVWKRPTVRAGGTLRTKVGVLSIGAVEPWTLRKVTEAEAKRAGFESKAALKAASEGREGTLYRVELKLSGEDPRLALREKARLSPNERNELLATLSRMDAASHSGPWTRAFLELIDKNPAVRAPDIAQQIGWTKPPFKRNVRKLKELGLTISLEVGYRLSPRGKSLLKHLRSPR